MMQVDCRCASDLDAHVLCAHSVDLPVGFHPRLSNFEDRGVLYHDLSCPLESGFNPTGRSLDATNPS